MSESPIIAKIKKLLATAGDTAASDNEIQSAINIAKKLMTQHHLTEDDLAHEPADDYKKVDDAKFDQIRSFVGPTVALWEQQLASVIREFTGSPCFVDNNKRVARKNGFVLFGANDEPRMCKSIVFYGVAEDAALACQLYDEMRELIIVMATGRTGKVYKSEGASYCQGFVSALCEKVKKAANLELKESTGNGALIVLRSQDLVKYKQDAAANWLKKDQGVKVRKGGRGAGSRVGFDRDAFRQGRTDGANAEMVAGERKKKLN